MIKGLESKIEERIRRMKSGTEFSAQDLISWLKDVYCFLDDNREKSYGLCLASICFIADKNPSDLMVQAILNEVIVKSRIFLYRNMLGKQNPEFLLSNPLGYTEGFAEWFYTDQATGIILTKSQKEVLKLFNEKRRLVLSAPTSFGKTKILEEIILNNDFKCIAVVVPTNALLSENYHRLKDNPHILYKYHIAYSSKIGKNFKPTQNIIFILTPEKLLNLLDDQSFTFDFFVFDEFYKISKDFESDESSDDYDKRYKVFQLALYTLVQNSGISFYMIGPYIDRFSKNFLEKERATFKEYQVEIVQKQIFADKKSIDEMLDIKLQRKDKKKGVYNILEKLREGGHQNLIYTPKQATAENIALFCAQKFSDAGIDVLNNLELRKFIKYIGSNISPEWDLIKILNSGVAFHHGGIPRYIQTEIVSLFNRGLIHSLVCTTTLAEGVNTTAKNVIVYEAKKSNTSLTTFDRKNIEGRSGRFAEHFIGNVFYLDKPEDNNQETSVDFELYDEGNLGPEDVILIEDKDLSEKNKKNKENVIKKLSEKNIPIQIVQKNRFINIDQQIDLIESLRKDPVLPFEDIKNNADFIRDTETMQMLFFNIYRLVNTDKRGSWKGYTAKQMAWLASDYIKLPYFKTILNNPIIENYSENLNTRIRKALRILNQHFEFLIPRYMQAFQEIYNFVANERSKRSIELGYVVSLLEYGTADQTEIILRDTGLPLEIVQKVKRYFNGCEDVGAIAVRKKERETDLRKILDEFEMKLLDRYL